MSPPKLPTYEPPKGFLFELRISLEAGNEYKVYVDSFNESFEEYHIPVNVQDIYPDAPSIVTFNVNQIAGLSARIVPGARMMEPHESPLPPYTKDGEVPF